jgi:hypothetical protein
MPKAHQRINFNLNLNYEKEIKKQPTGPQQRNIDMVLKWIIENRDTIFANKHAISSYLK